jgi:hypothetical protein
MYVVCSKELQDVVMGLHAGVSKEPKLPASFFRTIYGIYQYITVVTANWSEL